MSTTNISATPALRALSAEEVQRIECGEKITYFSIELDGATYYGDTLAQLCDNYTKATGTVVAYVVTTKPEPKPRRWLLQELEDRRALWS